MVSQTATHGWTRRFYQIKVDNPNGTVEVDGMVFGSAPLGLHFRDMYGIDVTHVPSGKRIAKLTSLGAALEFVHRIARLTDWTQMEPTLPARLQEILHTVTESARRPRMIT